MLVDLKPKYTIMSTSQSLQIILNKCTKLYITGKVFLLYFYFPDSRCVNAVLTEQRNKMPFEIRD